MKVTTYEGVVENGRVELPPGASLPEKAKVYVVVPEVVEIEAPRVAHVYSPRLANPADAVHFKMKVTKEGTDAGL
ncbi:MAG: hypothetical protein NTW96_06360 [Planctomycetia bacterium]|nr:hypothetical protein [Planctomycetia bacterium]